MEIKRGDVFLVDLRPAVGSEQGGIRPCVVLGNDCGNKYSPVVIVSPITSQLVKQMPTHVELSAKQHGLHKDSTVLCEHIKTIDKDRLCGIRLSSLDNETMKRLDKAMLISIGVNA